METISKIEKLEFETDRVVTVQAEALPLSSFDRSIFGFVSDFSIRHSCFSHFNENIRQNAIRCFKK